MTGTTRDPYVFQIGFDFGTAFSKAVIRDIIKDHAWPYTCDVESGKKIFLVPSVILYRDGKFGRHNDIASNYPFCSVFYIKMAISRAAVNSVRNIPELAYYETLFGEEFRRDPRKCFRLAGVYSLASVFADIIRSIKRAFPAFGAHPQDQLSITMAIPFFYTNDSRIENAFRDILHLAWTLALAGPERFDDSISFAELDDLARWAAQQPRNELCRVYPEVIANLQAFINSPASSPDERTIYCFSDVGAGTVDQCIFTYAGRDRKFHPFALRIPPLGSSRIESFICRPDSGPQCLEEWRNRKESPEADNFKEIKEAKSSLYDRLKKESKILFRETVNGYLYHGKGVEPKDQLREHCKFIFSGGGYTANPFKHAVTDAFREFVEMRKEPPFTTIPRPPDLELPRGHENWLNRLYVAYGLSFYFDNLSKYSLPKENKLEAENKKTTQKKAIEICSCGGLKPNCPQCSGDGFIVP